MALWKTALVVSLAWVMTPILAQKASAPIDSAVVGKWHFDPSTLVVAGQSVPAMRLTHTAIPPRIRTMQEQFAKMHLVLRANHTYAILGFQAAHEGTWQASGKSIVARSKKPGTKPQVIQFVNRSLPRLQFNKGTVDLLRDGSKR